MNARAQAGLTLAGDRFPLADNRNPAPAGPAPVPFGVRFFRHVGPTREVAAPPPYRYCPAHQVAVTADGTPVIDVPHLDAEPTTTGQGSGARGEEFRIDNLADALP